ncbi:hypothetical protein G3O07_16095 [Pseudomonas laurentiana]|uniref:Uncharacterized protein n=1 Tax=Pseudomonas laurentiana TaxID=2364649 RepID=A0A6I5RS35_9PSED|nr:hypothetical protein [Pseudomonas laurentiana]
MVFDKAFAGPDRLLPRAADLGVGPRCSDRAVRAHALDLVEVLERRREQAFLLLCFTVHALQLIHRLLNSIAAQAADVAKHGFPAIVVQAGEGRPCTLQATFDQQAVEVAMGFPDAVFAQPYGLLIVLEGISFQAPGVIGWVPLHFIVMAMAADVAFAVQSKGVTQVACAVQFNGGYQRVGFVALERVWGGCAGRLAQRYPLCLGLSQSSVRARAGHSTARQAADTRGDVEQCVNDRQHHRIQVFHALAVLTAHKGFYCCGRGVPAIIESNRDTRPGNE